MRRLPGSIQYKMDLEALEPRRLLSVNVLTWHNDNTRQGLNNHEVSLSPGNVTTGTFGGLFSYPATGAVYAQPLYVSNLTIPGKGIHNIVLVATPATPVGYVSGVSGNALNLNGGYASLPTGTNKKTGTTLFDD